MEDLNFIFTEDGVKLDYVNLTDDEIKDLNSNLFEIIYNFAFYEKPLENESSRFLQLISKFLVKEILNIPGLELVRENIEIDIEKLNIGFILDNKPMCLGNEYINEQWVKSISEKIILIYKKEISSFEGTVDLYFTNKNNKLITPSRIYFHLVESREDTASFAFMATYTTKENGNIKHYPLKYALKEYKNSLGELQELTKSLYNVSKQSQLIKKLIETGEIFSPIFINVDEAYEFLKEIELYEHNGIVCRVPNWWEQRKDSTSIQVNIEQKMKDGYGLLNEGSLIYVSPQMTYNGINITKEEINQLLLKTEGLSYIKDKWVEVDKKRLQHLLDQYEELKQDGSTLSEVLKKYSTIEESDINIKFSNPNWFTDIVQKNLERHPELFDVSKDFIGNLRPYQYDAYKWLLGMAQYNYGVCLADDMGLGKTIEILSFLLSYKHISKDNVLLIVPASLVGNWESEIKKFCPTMDYYIARKVSSNALKIKKSFLTITTYQVAQRLKSIYETNWGIVILDEAQAIKNPDTKQAKLIKSLNRRMSIAMTGTPIENNLLNLWSIFDFINEGLLGTETTFRKNYNIKSSDPKNVGKLSKIIKPFILRRLKTDKNIIKDLPEKNETIIYTELTKKQIILYKKIVSEIEGTKISEENQFTQKRIILTAILHLKQVCNHPSQFIGDNEYIPEDSGKFMALKDLCEIMFEKREKVLIFTQFKEITYKLNDFLEKIFKKRGLVITGDTPMNTRNKYIEAFQNGDIPYMILSLKAAGVGLNLTAASNVIHFDRWWNPAVENQATDRTFRIGQTRNVNVYKFTTKNTVEEIISHLIDIKVELSDSIIGDIDNNVLNKLSSEQLLESIKYTGDENE